MESSDRRIKTTIPYFVFLGKCAWDKDSFRPEIE